MLTWPLFLVELSVRGILCWVANLPIADKVVCLDVRRRCLCDIVVVHICGERLLVRKSEAGEVTLGRRLWTRSLGEYVAWRDVLAFTLRVTASPLNPRKATVSQASHRKGLVAGHLDR